MPAGKTRPRLWMLVLLAGIAACSAFPARASLGTGGQMPADLDVPVRGALSQSSALAGDSLSLAVIYEVPPDAHIQQNEFFFAHPAEGEPLTLGNPVLPRTVEFEGEPVFQGKTVVYYPVRLSAGLTPGLKTLHLVAGHQACTERPVFACFAPKETELALNLEIAAAGSPTRQANDELFAAFRRPVSRPSQGTPAVVSPQSAAAPPPPAVSGGLAGRLQEALARRSLLAFLLVFLGGIATSFTPCVYPMIPITISYIGGRSRSRLGGLFLSIFFVLGIALTYSILGLLAAESGALFGGAMQSVPVLVGVSVVFFAMGASMLGAFDLALPSEMQTRLQSGPRAGIVGAFLMGIVTGLVASPCVGPVVVVLLTWVAQIGSAALGFLLLFTFALGLGMLFLVIGTFAGALNALPQAGSWMDTVKHLFGVILLGMGIYYLHPLIGPVVTNLAVGVYLVLLGTFAGAFHPVPEVAPKSVLAAKGLGLILLLVGAFVLLLGLAGVAHLDLRGASGAASAPVAEGLNWQADDVQGLEQARAQGRPALIDFYADWCGACKELDEKSWSDPAVRAEGNRFVAIKLDLTRKSEANANKQAAYRVPGLPTVIFFDASGKEAARFSGFRPAGEVLAAMREVR
jgi:thioredoxin:protein disulfide reductase